jgi:hypothetical protein
MDEQKTRLALPNGALSYSRRPARVRTRRGGAGGTHPAAWERAVRWLRLGAASCLLGRLDVLQRGVRLASAEPDSRARSDSSDSPVDTPGLRLDRDNRCSTRARRRLVRHRALRQLPIARTQATERALGASQAQDDACLLASLLQLSMASSCAWSLGKFLTGKPLLGNANRPRGSFCAGPAISPICTSCAVPATSAGTRPGLPPFSRDR